MKIHVLSDLHLEGRDFIPPHTDADVVVLAGDIDVGVGAIRWAQMVFNTPVIYVLGNHEYYRSDLSLIHRMRELSEGTNVHVLERDSVVIDGVKFLGTTLWTDFLLYGRDYRPDAMSDVERGLADFRLISDGGLPFTAARSLSLHEQSREWLDAELSSALENKRVVVTHHAPSLRSESDAYRGGRMSPGFISDLDDILAAHDINLWVHGHTHYSVDYVLNDVRVVSNQRGYRGEGVVFNPGFVVEI